VSSRAEEKAQRRKEREEAEAAAARATGRTRRLQIVGGTILGVALIAVLVAVVAGGGGGGGGGGNGKGPNKDAAPSSAKIPAQQIADFNAAVKASGCTYEKLPIQGRGHTTAKVDYDTNPPASGPHNPTPAQDGKYDPGNQPETEMWVHSLEHGRVVTMYKPGTPQTTIDQLSALFDERLNGTEGYHQLLLQNTTKMPYDVAMVAWGQSLTCKTMNPKVFDAFRAFRKRFVDKGPEFFP
jgi:hypothetical protein